MFKIKIFSLAIFYFLLFASFACAAGDLAVIVNKGNEVNELSFKDLVKIFKQEKQYWDGHRIYLIMQEVGSYEKGVVLKRVYKMTDEKLKRFWLAKIFRGEISSFPKTLSSNEAVKRFVMRAPNSVGFIDAACIDERIKVLRIDGKFPGEEGYKLAADIQP